MISQNLSSKIYYSRPFDRELLQAAKSADGKAPVLEGVRIVEDFAPSDLNAHEKGLSLMQAWLVENSTLLEEKLLKTQPKFRIVFLVLKSDSHVPSSCLLEMHVQSCTSKNEFCATLVSNVFVYVHHSFNSNHMFCLAPTFLVLV